MNLDDISTQLLFITLPISAFKNTDNTEFGTGFIINCSIKDRSDISIPLLVTNWHVVSNAKTISLKLCAANDDGSPKSNDRIETNLDGSDWLKYRDEELDIAIIPMAPIFTNLIASGKKFFYKSISFDLFPSESTISEFAALEEIIFIGYPSGIQDSFNQSPLIRKGITATPIWRDFENKPRFVIDAGVFPGSSGSPVFLFNQGGYTTKKGLHLGSRLNFLGILTTTFIRKEIANQSTYLGLGEVIKSYKVKEFIEKSLSQMTTQ